LAVGLGSYFSSGQYNPSIYKFSILSLACH